MFYILPYQNDPEASQAVQGTETDNPIEGSSTTQQVTTTIPASLSFIIQPIQVQQNNIEVISKARIVKRPEEIVKITNTPSTLSLPAKQLPSALYTPTITKQLPSTSSIPAKETPSTSSIPAKKRKVEENIKKPDIKSCRCGMCWRTFPNCEQLEVHKCPKATDTCNCTLCIAAKKTRKEQKKYKCCSMCSTYFKCVHFLKKHVDRYHGSCICQVCKTKFKTRTQCCKHRCRGPRKESQKNKTKRVTSKKNKSQRNKPQRNKSQRDKSKINKSKRDDSLDSDSDWDSDSDFNPDSDLDSAADSDFDTDSDVIDGDLKDIEVDKTKTSNNEVLQENDIEIEYIIQSTRPDSPPLTFTSIQRKEDYHKISEVTDNSSQITLETPVLINIHNRSFLANEVNIEEGPVEDLNIADNYSKNNPKQQNNVSNVNMNFVGEKRQEGDIFTLEGSDNENNFKSGNKNEKQLLNVRSNEIQPNLKYKTDVTVAVTDDIETFESIMVTNDGFKTNPNGTDLVKVKNAGDDDATKINKLMTYSDNNKTEIGSIMIPGSDNESITSETEPDWIEGNKITNEVMDAEISKSTDNIANDDEIHHERETNIDKSPSSMLHGISELESPHTLRSNVDTVKVIKNTILRIYACITCKKNFPNENDLMLHNKNHKLEKDLNISDAGLAICNYCNMSLNKSVLHDHILFYHHQSKHIVKLEDDILLSEKQEPDAANNFQCGICTEVYHDKWVLNYHIEQEHKTVTDNSVETDQIQPKFTRESYLDFKDF